MQAMGTYRHIRETYPDFAELVVNSSSIMAFPTPLFLVSRVCDTISM